MQNDKLSLIKRFKETYLLYSNTALIIKHQTRTKMRIIRKLNWGQQQTTLIKFSFSLLLHSTHVSPNQDQICKDDKYPIKSKFNRTGLDNKDVAITRASSFLSVDNIRFLPLCVGSTLLITPNPLANGCCIRNACNFKKSMQFQLWIGNLHILGSVGTDTLGLDWQSDLEARASIRGRIWQLPTRRRGSRRRRRQFCENQIWQSHNPHSSQYGEDHFPPLLRLEKQKIRDHFPDETSHRAFSSDQTLDKYTVTSWSLVRPTPLALSLWIFKTYIAEANIQYLLPNFNFS